MKKVTAIICAYNEEETIKEVIESVSKSLDIDEIIVVNDGSTDATGRMIESININNNFVDIHLKQNKGKGFAMATGAEYTSNEILVFIDADLYNITNTHISQLVKPLLLNYSDMVLGQPTETLIASNINPFKSFTGQRSVFKADILPILNKMKKSRFGVETLLNLHYQSEEKRIKYINLRGLRHPTKFEKTSTENAIMEFLAEGLEITKTALKNRSLVSLIVKNKIINNTI